jgi:HEAT repeat protein
MTSSVEDLTVLVKRLADPHRSFPAYQRLLALGEPAAVAARAGLKHPDPRVRSQCCRILDHLLDAESLPALTRALADPDAEVRIAAAHALSCDRCKGDACRPSAAAVLPSAIRMLQHDPAPRARAMAAELVGAWVHTHPEAARALEAAAENDPSPSVRKKTGWYAPGGVIHRRTARSRPR